MLGREVMYTYKNVYEYKILLDASSWFSDS